MKVNETGTTFFVRQAQDNFFPGVDFGALCEAKIGSSPPMDLLIMDLLSFAPPYFGTLSGGTSHTVLNTELVFSLCVWKAAF